MEPQQENSSSAKRIFIFQQTTQQLVRLFVPTPGNVLFTLIVVVSVLWAQGAGALPLSAPTQSTTTNTLPYQGWLADADGNPLNNTYDMTFRIYDAATGGTLLWTEQWTGPHSVQVSGGLFSVMLGSLTPVPNSILIDNNTLFLGITVGTDEEMTPRVQFGSVPWAVQALTVADTAVTTAKIADGAVTHPKLSLPHGSVCLNTDPTVPVPGNWGRVTIPNMTLSLTLDADGQLLVWSSGIYQFDKASMIATAIEVDGAEAGVAFQHYSGSIWTNYAIVRIVPVSAGSHTIDLRAGALESGNMLYNGSGGRQTCLEYIVLS